MSAEQVLLIFPGSAFISTDGNWSWQFGSNGVAQSSGLKGDSPFANQILAIEGDKLCLGQGVSYVCGSVYRDGDVLHFRQTGGKGGEVWSIKRVE